MADVLEATHAGSLPEASSIVTVGAIVRCAATSPFTWIPRWIPPRQNTHPVPEVDLPRYRIDSCLRRVEVAGGDRFAGQPRLAQLVCEFVVGEVSKFTHVAKAWLKFLLRVPRSGMGCGTAGFHDGVTTLMDEVRESHLSRP